ncbi:MAG: hypothetical protein Q9198_007218 [Flavoplaca austrocitrina]
MESSEMSWTPSSSIKKRKYNEYCDTISVPAFPHVPGAYPQSPVSYADFGREMYLVSSAQLREVLLHQLLKNCRDHLHQRLVPSTKAYQPSRMHQCVSFQLYRSPYEALCKRSPVSLPQRRHVPPTPLASLLGLVDDLLDTFSKTLHLYSKQSEMLQSALN